MNIDLKKYKEQKKAAKRRGIEFKLTFEEWYEWWQQTGHYHERGMYKGQYCMCRINDTGPYELGNIYCDLTSNNTRVAHAGKIVSDETKKKMSKPKSEAHKQSMRKPKSQKALDSYKIAAKKRGNNGVMNDAEARAKISQRMKEIWAERKAA